MVKFKKFKVKDLFTSESGNTDLKQVDINGLGLPVITSGQKNYGILGLTDKKAKIISRNTITVDMFGYAYYRDFEYKMVTHARVFALIPKNNFHMSINSGLYIQTCLNKLVSKYSYNNMCSFNKIKNECIVLPVINNKIDFDYMDKYIAELKQQRIAELDCYLHNTGLNDYHLSEEDKSILTKKIKMKDFRIGDLFVIKKGKRLTKANQIKGEIPFVGSSSINNGITAYISNNKYMHPAGSITVTYNGSVGQSFLQDKDFWASDDVNVLYSKYNISKEAKLYLITSLKKLSVKYSYNFKWTKEKMNNDTIALPVTNNQKPDWKYMERYIKAIEKLTIKNVVDYKDQVIASTKTIVDNQ